METTFSSSIIISLLADFLANAGVSVIPYKPPLPHFNPDSFESCMEELKCSPQQIMDMTQKFETSWNSILYLRQHDARQKLNQNSGLGMLLKSLEPFALEFEELKYQEIRSYFNHALNPFYQNITAQGLEMANSIWEIGGQYISKHLVEGAFLGSVERSDYSHCVKFSFDRMMYHYAKFSALNLVYQHQKSVFLTTDQKTNLQDALTQQLTRYESWHYRWILSEKMSSMDYMLNCYLTHYEGLKFSIIENYNKNKSDPYPPSTPKIYKQIAQFQIIMTELKASFYNLMLDLKPTNKYDRFIQQYLTRAIHWIYNYINPSKINETRSFFQVFEDASCLIDHAYEDLFPWDSRLLPQEEILKKYMTAVSEDNFIAAKWISLQCTSKQFEWLKEAGAFENYKREVEKFIHIQNQIDEIIFELTRMNTDYSLNHLEDNRRVKELFDQQEKIVQLIRDWWSFRESIDLIRIELKLGVFKRLKTELNQQKGYWERFCTSCQNKALRLFMSAAVCDSTRPYAQIQQEFPRLFQQYETLLKKSQSFFKNTDSFTPSFSPIYQSYKMNLLKLKTEKDLPVFYHKDTYVEYARLYEGKTLLSQVLTYNLKRLRQFHPKSVYWKQEEKIVRKYNSHFWGRESAKRILISLKSYPLNSKQKRDLEGLLEMLKNYSSSYLNKILVKYIISEKNRQDDENNRVPPIGRILTSAKHKINRYQTEGQFIDMTPEFPFLYETIKKSTDDIVQGINALVDELCADHPEFNPMLECQYIVGKLVYVPVG